MSQTPTSIDLAMITVNAGAVTLLASVTPRLTMAVAYLITVLMALWHPDRKRRAEAGRLLRHIGKRDESRNRLNRSRK